MRDSLRVLSTRLPAVVPTPLRYGLLSRLDAPRTDSAKCTQAYLWPNEHRSNLKVISNATVTKVNLARQGSKYEATGVNFRMGGEDYTIGAQREVIISAGSVMTPQLLELSGIGQKELLNKYGIDVKIDLPGVGENLQGKLTWFRSARRPGSKICFRSCLYRECVHVEGW